jgi:hypothetical protein
VIENREHLGQGVAEELPKVIEKKPLLEDAEWTADVLEPAPPRRRPVQTTSDIRAGDLRH